VAQNDMEGGFACSAADRRAVADNAAPPGAKTQWRETSEMVIAEQRPLDAVLLGQRTLLLEGLKHILDNTDFQVIASASTIDELDLHPVQGDRKPLFIFDAGP
jgi:hypothetical protein